MSAALPPHRRHRKPPIIDNPTWERICNHLHRGEPEAQLAERQRAYAEYLREGSAAMTRNWPNSLRAIRDRQCLEQAERDRAYQQALVEQSEALSAGDRALQAERIAAAQRMLDRAKAGPRQLKSAYLFAEVLKTRELQREHNAQLRCEDKVRDRKADLEEIAHIEQTMGERFDAFAEQRQRACEFKVETRMTVCERAQHRCAERQKRLAEERRFLESERMAMACEKAQKAQRLRCCKAMEKRRVFEEIRGKLEQRRKTQLVETIDDKIIATIGQPQQYNIERNRKLKATIAERYRRQQEGAERVQRVLEAATEQAERDDERRYEEAKAEKLAIADAAEATKLEAAQKKRCERRQYECEAKQDAQQRRQGECQKFQFKVATRMQNATLTGQCEQKKKDTAHEKCMQNRMAWLEQIAERAERTRQEKDEASAAVKKAWIKAGELEDEQFFEYAKTYMEEAEKKKRSVYPLRKCIETYRKKNELQPDCKGDGPK